MNDNELTLVTRLLLGISATGHVAILITLAMLFWGWSQASVADSSLDVIQPVQYLPDAFDPQQMTLNPFDGTPS